MKLQNKIAIVTGAGQGIGKTIATFLAQEGAQVCLVDMNLSVLEETARNIETAIPGSKILPCVANVTKMDEVDKMVSTVTEKWGRIDFLINNAGITRDNLLLRMSEDEWDAVLAVNLKGVFVCTKISSRVMLKQRSGRIVNIASVVGLMGNAGQINYAASKGGVIALTKTCARELASRNILVNAVAPGYIRTAMTDKLSPDVKENLLKLIPLGRLGEPEDVARVVVFLCSEDAAYITGQVISVNGGMYM